MSDHHAKLLRLETLDPEVIKKFVSLIKVDDVEYLNFTNFGIDDSRLLVEKAFVRPIVGQVQLLVVTFKQITVEAQQALLKILEEPPLATNFLFCIPTTLHLLPTLRSRFHVIDGGEIQASEVIVGDSFIKLSTLNYGDRLTEIAERIKAKDQDWVTEIKVGLLSWLDQQDLIRLDPELSQTLLWSATLLQTRGAANKYLLEEIALSLPVAAEK
jgi:DNA polymerase-3 subunit delta'